MKSWQSSFRGIRALPRDLSEFELQAFFSFGADERRLIETRRTDARQLGLALHIGFIRRSGQMLHAKRIVPVRLWQHLGVEIGVPNPEVATLKAMYRRGRTLLDYQRMACDQLCRGAMDNPARIEIEASDSNNDASRSLANLQP